MADYSVWLHGGLWLLAAIPIVALVIECGMLAGVAGLFTAVATFIATFAVVSTYRDNKEATEE
jgi:ribose/xylose/arabinose/galactoside ABC-type transport system permease subunit